MMERISFLFRSDFYFILSDVKREQAPSPNFLFHFLKTFKILKFEYCIITRDKLPMIRGFDFNIFDWMDTKI